MNQPDEDALWRSIVDNYGERAMLDPRTDREGSADGPVGAETADEAAQELGPQRDNERIVEPVDPAATEAGDRLDAWDDPEDHFVPPEPPPLPRLAPPQLLAWAGVFGTPVLTVAMAVLHLSVPIWASLLGLVWFVGGFGFLVATMRRDDDNDDWDDGAVL